MTEAREATMEKVLLGIIAASALCDASLPPKRIFYLVDEAKNWTEAQRYCRETYTDLATVEDMEDVETLNKMGKIYLWIGLYNDVDSWRWSMSDPDFYQHDGNEFRSWSPGEPDNDAGQESCGAMLSDGVWDDKPCSLTLNPICFNVTGLNAAFVFINTTMNWTDAQSYCRQHHTDLASVRNMSENQEVKQMIPSGHMVWIGMYRDTWKWSDGSNSSFRYWNTGEPYNDEHMVENCVTPYTGVGKWESWDCGVRREFVCYIASECPTIVPELSCMTGRGQNYRGKISVTKNNKPCQNWVSQTPQRHSFIPTNFPCSGLELNNCRNPRRNDPSPWCYTTDPSTRWDYCDVPVCSGPAPVSKQVVKLNLVSSSSVDLNDPVVLENLQKQLQQKLKDQGDVRLSWRKQTDGRVFHKEEKKGKSRNEL